MSQLFYDEDQAEKAVASGEVETAYMIGETGMEGSPDGCGKYGVFKFVKATVMIGWDVEHWIDFDADTIEECKAYVIKQCEGYYEHPEKVATDLAEIARQPTGGDIYEEPFDHEGAVEDLASEYAEEFHVKSEDYTFTKRCAMIVDKMRVILDTPVAEGKIPPYLANVFSYQAIGTLYTLSQEDLCKRESEKEMHAESYG